jgi:molybdopterin-binding protein
MSEGLWVSAALRCLSGGDPPGGQFPGDLLRTGQHTNCIFRWIDNIHACRIAGSEHHIRTVEVAGVPLYVGEAPPNTGKDATVIFRGEDVTLGLGEPARTSARNVLAGTVAEIADITPFVHMKVDCGFPVSALVTARSAEEMALSVGTTVWVSVKASAVHLIAETAERSV